MKNRKIGALKVAVGIILVKDRIQQFYIQSAQLEKGLREFKRKHGYCAGRPFCMNMVSEGVHSCSECVRANANPKYKKTMSAYGEMRARERDEERSKKKKTKAKKAA